MTLGKPSLTAFSGYGIELEYMIVDRDSLAVLPIADELLKKAAASEGVVAEVDRGHFAWSNELVLHLLELKNATPDARLDTLAAGFQAEVKRIDEILSTLGDRGARLMPTAMHPWLDPRRETRLWPHEHAAIYATYDRIFDCHAHGWANIQSMHLNLPFAGDEEFARLHAAVRLLLPILPAIAASSPVVEGRGGDALDMRMAYYRLHPARVPALIGQVVPDNVTSHAEYAATVLAPMYRDIAPHDPEGILRHEWLNARVAMPRFDRNAIEIRVIDVQECPRADVAIAALTSAVVKAIYDGRWSTTEAQRAIDTGALASILLDCIRDGECAAITDANYLGLFGFPRKQCEAGELWQHLFAACADNGLPNAEIRATLDTILARGPLARRILRTLGTGFDRPRLEAVYRDLCDCLADGRLFLGPEP